MVPFGVLSIIRHLVFRGPSRDNFDKHPCSMVDSSIVQYGIV